MVVLSEHIRENMKGGFTMVFLAKVGEFNKQAGMFQKIAIGHETLSYENLEERRPAD